MIMESENRVQMLECNKNKFILDLNESRKIKVNEMSRL